MSEKIPRGSIDQRILEELQLNGRVSLKEIASRLHIPVSTVHEKVRRLEREGFISSYHAVLNAEQLGFGVTFFVLVSVDYGAANQVNQKAVAESIAKLPGVQEVHILAGDWDILVKAKEKNVKSAGSFVTERLRKIKGVEKTSSIVVFDTVAESSKLDI